MTYRLLHGDVLSFARHYHGEPFHALICDPPYELKFMGRKWDSTGIAFRPETWAALAELLHPGAFGMTFGGSRTWHRIACAIEDAGMVIHPTVFCWLQSQGFPKATRIDTQIDKAAGAEREVVGEGPYAKRRPNGIGGSVAHGDYGDTPGHPITAPATPMAQAWAGHRYGLQAMKPAVEPILLFQKPYVGRSVDSITATGAGAINIDGGRIPADNKTRFPKGYSRSGYSEGWPVNHCDSNPSSRWPANFALVCSGPPHCNGQHGPECPIRRLDEQSGEGRSGVAVRRNGVHGGVIGPPGNKPIGTPDLGYGDSGGASRFYHNADWNAEVAERLADADPVRYQAKASRRERDSGLDGMMQLRSDLTDEQRAYVMRELAAAGVLP